MKDWSNTKRANRRWLVEMRKSSAVFVIADKLKENIKFILGENTNVKLGRIIWNQDGQMSMAHFGMKR